MAENGFDEDMKSAKEILANLRNNVALIVENKRKGRDTTVENSSQITDILKQNVVNIIDMKIKNRRIQFCLEKVKNALFQRRDEVDKKNLGFQSLIYQKNSIQAEITDCRGFPMPELKKIGEFSNINSSQEAVYKEINSSLSKELEVRKKMSSEHQQSVLESEKKVVDLEALQSKYSQCPALLEKLEEVSRPLQEYFGVPSRIISEKLQESKKLPPPLFTIFAKFESYREQFHPEDFEVQILEDAYGEVQGVAPNIPEIIENARHSHGKEVKLEEEKRQNGEILDVSKSIKKKKHKKAAKRPPGLFFPCIKIESEKASLVPDKLFQKCPVGVKVVFHNLTTTSVKKEFEREIYPIEIFFMYYPELNLITVSSKSKKLSSLQLLSELFIQDDGRILLKHFNNSPLSWTSEDEQPYSWANFLGGIIDFSFMQESMKKICDNPIKKSKYSEEYLFDPMSITIQKIVNKLSNRVLYQSALRFQVEHLLNSRRIPSEIHSSINSDLQFAIVKEKCVLREFTQIARENFISRTNFEQLSSFSLGITESNAPKINVPQYVKTEEGIFVKRYKEFSQTCAHESGQYFTMLIERDNFQVRAFIEIGHDYPQAIPQFHLSMEAVKKPNNAISKLSKMDKFLSLEPSNFGYSHILKEMEDELHLYFSEYCYESEKPNLLSYQIKKLMVCCEIFAQTEQNKLTSLYKIAQQGIFRSRPFHFNPATQSYEQR